MTLKYKKIIFPLLFVLILGGLMTIASLFDLEISKILTKGALAPGAFYTHNFMGALVEVIGSFPIFAILLLATLSYGHVFFKKDNNLKYLGWIFVILSIVDTTWITRDTFKYILRLVGNEPLYKEWWMMIIYIAIGTPIALVSHYFYLKKVDVEKNKKFITLSWVILVTCVSYLVVNMIKGPVGRMRYRAMNMIGDFSSYTPWYVISSAKETYASFNLSSDCFKSFPSGHTNSAGCCYALLALPDLFEKFNNKKSKTILYISTVLYTALVGIYRIRVGAHFMSDVTIGGTLSYLFAQIGRHIFTLGKNGSKNTNEKIA